MHTMGINLNVSIIYPELNGVLNEKSKGNVAQECAILIYSS